MRYEKGYLEEAEIKYISEAFSMQPEMITVGNTVRDNKGEKKGSVSKIELSLIDFNNTPDADSTAYYAVYCDNGDIVCKWRADTCNVGYF